MTILLLGTAALVVAGIAAERSARTFLEGRSPRTETAIRVRQLNAQFEFAPSEADRRSGAFLTSSRLDAWKRVVAIVAPTYDAWAEGLTDPTEEDPLQRRREALTFLIAEWLDEAPPARDGDEGVRKILLDALEVQQMSPDEFEALTRLLRRETNVLRFRRLESRITGLEQELDEARRELEAPDLSDEERASRAKRVAGMAGFIEAVKAAIRSDPGTVTGGSRVDRIEEDLEAYDADLLVAGGALMLLQQG